MRSLFCALSIASAYLAAVPAQGPAADVDALFAKALPAEAEARWTSIPWRRSLTRALAEAKATGKPIYLFVNDGNVDTGQC